MLKKELLITGVDALYAVVLKNGILIVEPLLDMRGNSLIKRIKFTFDLIVEWPGSMSARRR